MQAIDQFDRQDEMYLASLKARTAKGQLSPMEKAAQRQDDRTRRMLAQWRAMEKARREF